MNDFNKTLLLLPHNSRTVSPFNPITGHKVIGVSGSMIRCYETEAFPAKPLSNYEIHTNPDTGEVFPHCCGTHKEIFNEAQEWARNAKMDPLRSEIYAEKVTAQLSYTEYCISELLKSDLTTDDFVKNICEYIEYNIMSFGPLYGGHIHFLNKLIESMNDDHRITENVRCRVEEYLLQAFNLYQWEILDEAELKPLNDAIKEWIDMLPYDLDAFEQVHSSFSNLDNTLYVPVITKVNYYGVNILLRSQMENAIQDDLYGVTEILLENIRAYYLVKDGKLDDPQQRLINIVLAQDENERKKIKLEYEGKKNDCHDIITKWLEREKKFLNNIIPVLHESRPSKTDIFKSYLQIYDFYDLPMVEALSPDNQEKLLNLMIEKGMPYTIAMFNYLQFLLHLSKEYFKAKSKLCIEISKWFDSDTDGRTVKGNINVLSHYSNEDKARYTAHQYIDTVCDDYQNLK